MIADPSTPVAIAGAGPVGLSLALGLARSGIRSVVFEQKVQPDPHSRATLILPRTLEILGQWGVLHQLVSAGDRVPHVRLREAHNDHQIAHIDFTALAEQTAATFALAIPQDRTEAILLEAVQATGLVDVHFATELLGFEQCTDGIHLRTRTDTGEATGRARYLVGADGAHSRVRHQLGFELVGKTYPTQALLADVRIDPAHDRTGVWPTILNHRGLIVGIRFGNGVWRIIEQAVDVQLTGPAMDDHIADLAQQLFGSGPVKVIWHSVYHKHQRRVPQFHHGRVALVGDAGHLNSPAGGQGMNSGIQDAHNIAWKLAAAVTTADADADALLESYSQERTALVGRRVQPVTDRAEWFQTARPAVRVPMVRALDALLGLSHSAGSLTHTLSMLTVEYPTSRLIRGRAKGLGYRVPDAIADDGERIYAKIPAGGILYAGPDAGPRALARHLGLPLVNGDIAALTRFFDREEFVALVRPDHIVGAVTDPAVSDTLAFAAALGRSPREGTVAR